MISKLLRMTLLAGGILANAFPALAQVDFSKNPLAVGAVWDNRSSTNSMSIVPATSTSPMQIYAMGRLMVPNAASTGTLLRMITPTTAGWARTSPPTHPAVPTPSPYVPRGYAYVGGDEFDEASLDQTKWWTRYANPATAQYIPSNKEQELFEEGQDSGPNHVMLSGGGIALRAYPPLTSGPNAGRYPSGMLRMKQTFNFGSATTSFYIEIKAKIPNSTGAWPAFWFTAEPNNPDGVGPWPPEMDAAEFMVQPPGGSTTADVHMNVKTNGPPPGRWNIVTSGTGTVYHTNPSPTGWQWLAPYGDSQWQTTEDLSADYHVYGILITPGVAGQNTTNPATGQLTHAFAYSLDGYRAAYGGQYDFQEGADGTCCYNAELLLDYAVGGFGGGTPDPTKFPSDFDIAYVRIYELNGPADGAIDGSISTIGTDETCGSGGC